MARILFFNSPTKYLIYGDTNIKNAAPSYPNLTLATLAGSLTADHKVKILDLDLSSNPLIDLIKAIKVFKPEIVATSAKTTEYLSAKAIMTEVKNKFPEIKTIIGGVHVTAFPESTALNNCFDIIVIGEGDFVLPEILHAKSLSNIAGVIHKNKAGKLIINKKRDLIKDINCLPYPAWKLFDLSKYRNSHLSSRKNPVGHLETSRGCAYQCNFCNKLTFGSVFRVKSVKRVVDEMEYMLESGFKEIHIVDDSFTQDIKRAKLICQEIIDRKLFFPWSLINGIRVNLVDEEFFELAKKAGCWQIGFGIETGSQRVLNRINKQITLSQVEKAVKLADKYNINSFGFFIFGLLGETIDSMEKTINFALKLPLSVAKFDICIPYPGTKYFNLLMSKKRIINYNWTKYNVHLTNEPIFLHPTLKWSEIEASYKQAFVKYYFRPGYFYRRFIKSLKQGDLIKDFRYLISYLLCKV